MGCFRTPTENGVGAVKKRDLRVCRTSLRSSMSSLESDLDAEISILGHIVIK